MKTNNFEEWLTSNSNSTIDFQIIPIDLVRAGGSSNRFCIIPINRTDVDSSIHAVFDVEGDVVKLIQEGQGSQEITQGHSHLNDDAEPSQEAIAAIETLEDYLTLYSCNLELRIEASERRLYIHPSNKNGATLTFEAQGDNVALLLLNNHNTTSVKEEETATL